MRFVKLSWVMTLLFSSGPLLSAAQVGAQDAGKGSQYAEGAVFLEPHGSDLDSEVPANLGTPTKTHCTSTIGVNQMVAGSWDSTCPSANRPEAFAHYYTFTLSGHTAIQIDLESSTTDTYLFLLSGASSSGTVIASNDDGGAGLNSRIVATASSPNFGTFTIEATTFRAGATGSFTLSLQATGGGGGCPWPVGHVHYCRDCGPCESGEGDCDSSGECQSGLTCFYDVGANYGFASDIDVCEPAGGCPWPVGHVHYCRDCGPCGSGEGDCDNSGECQGGLTCFHDVGANYGFASDIDVCEPSGGGNCVSTIGLNQNVGGQWTSDCNSTHRSGSFANFFTFTVTTSTAVRIDLESSRDTYLYLLDGSSVNDAVLDLDDDGGSGTNSQIVAQLAAGTYTIEATTFSSSTTGSFSLSLSADGATSNVMVFLVHGLSQRGGSLAGLRSTLEHTTFGLDTSLFTIDDGFGWGECADVNNCSSENMDTPPDSCNLVNGSATFCNSIGGCRPCGVGQGDCDRNNECQYGLTCVDNVGANYGFSRSTDVCEDRCFIWNGGERLAEYINGQNPGDTIVLIGYSLGGLIIRDMLANNYSNVMTNRRAAVMITLGTPNAGYPYCDRVDGAAKCDIIVEQMASHFRLTQGSVTLSDYLFNLSQEWGRPSFPGLPDYWLAVAGTYCDDDQRFCEWNSVNSSRNQGCRDNTDSDGVVCTDSALYRLNVTNTPHERWEGADYAHSDNDLLWCSGPDAQFRLPNPPAGGALVRRIREVINGS